MATVTGMTADRMLAIEAASVVDGDVDGSGNLILTKHDGTQINAGSVIGPTGPQGPVGSDLVVASAVPVLDVGLVNQIRAGRQLTAADFTNMGLSAPLGLWNLSDLSDVSGNGRNLLNKTGVSFSAGINGLATTAAQFIGSNAQALYIPDTGVADPFRIKTGSWGCWFRTAKRGTINMLLDKYGTANQQCYTMYTGSANLLGIGISPDGVSNAVQVVSASDVADDRWHFGVATYDGVAIRVYVDSVLEGVATFTVGAIFGGSSPLNIGSRGADGGTNGVFPSFGRVDEAFVTADVLSEEQIRNLYCAKLSHTLAAVPSRVSLNVRRRRRGATLVSANFPTQPLRLHNFSGGSLGDEGSNGIALFNNGGAVSVSGVDGSSGNAFSFAGTQILSSTDAGVPAALVTRSYGCWVKTVNLANPSVILAWGTGTTNNLNSNAGGLFSFSGSDSINGPFIADGLWHHVVVVENNSPSDGIKRKLYVDGRLVGISTVMNAITPGGAGYFCIGAYTNGSAKFNGQVDSVFVCDYALTFEQIVALYVKSSQALTPSPKNVGDHVEGMDATALLAIFDTLESQNQIDLRVAA